MPFDLFGQFNLLDPRDFDDDLFDRWYGYRLPPYYVNSQSRGEVLPVYRDWLGLKIIRDRNRRLAAENEFAICAVENRKNYAVGDGLQYKVVCDNDSLRDMTQSVVDIFAEHNDLATIEAECVTRSDTDGEAFLRFFPRSTGILDIRFIEPEHVKDPEGDAYSPAHSFGVETDADDVENIKGYWIIHKPYENQACSKFVPADQIQHIKFNVNRSAKRGLPTFYPIESNLRRAEDLLASMSATVKTQCKVAMIRHFEGTDKNAVQRMIDSLKDGTVTDQRTGSTLNMEQLRPGTILNASKNITYEFPTQGLNAAKAVEVLQAELRACAARLVMPEWMFTVDASNANYSSSLIAEAPAVKAFRRLQRILARAFGEGRYGRHVSVVWRQIRYAVSCGVLPQEALTQCEVQVEGPSLVVRDKGEEATVNKTYYDMGIKSPQTIAQEQGLDYEQEQQNRAELGLSGPSDPEPPMPGEPGTAPTQEAFDESKHPRDHGKFSESPGASGGEPQGQKRAKAGGEEGPNGEWYPGGAFIATTDLPKREKDKLQRLATGKVQVDGYEWAVPEPGQMAILDKLGGTVLNPRNGEVNYGYLEYIKASADDVKMYEELAEKWKAGERWVSVNDFPNIAGTKDAARLVVAGQPIPGALLDKLPAEVRDRLGKYKPETSPPAAPADDSPQIEATPGHWAGKYKVGDKYFTSKKAAQAHIDAQKPPEPPPAPAAVKPNIIDAPEQHPAADYVAALKAIPGVQFRGKDGSMSADNAEEFARAHHKDAVKRALKAGKTVPPEVLADYPDLVKRPVQEDFKEGDHPRDKAGKFIDSAELRQAARDPAKMAELRKRVRPEDRDKLEKHHGDHTAEIHKDSSELAVKLLYDKAHGHRTEADNIGISRAQAGIRFSGETDAAKAHRLNADIAERAAKELESKLPSARKPHDSILPAELRPGYKHPSKDLTPELQAMKERDLAAAAKHSAGGSAQLALPDGGKWDRAAGEAMAHRLSTAAGSRFQVVGSVATKGKSDHDVDILSPGPFDRAKADAELSAHGFEYQGQSLLSPKEAAGAGKQFAQNSWSELHHYKNLTTGHKLELWAVLPPDKAAAPPTPSKPDVRKERAGATGDKVTKLQKLAADYKQPGANHAKLSADFAGIVGTLDQAQARSVATKLGLKDAGTSKSSVVQALRRHLFA